jgi:hypothetical protein
MMRIHIDTPDDASREQIIQRLHYSLVQYREDLESVQVVMHPEDEVSGRTLNRCRLTTRLRRNQVIEVEEKQAEAEFALYRALERTLRMVRRRVEGDPALSN